MRAAELATHAVAPGAPKCLLALQQHTWGKPGAGPSVCKRRVCLKTRPAGIQASRTLVLMLLSL